MSLCVLDGNTASLQVFLYATRFFRGEPCGIFAFAAIGYQNWNGTLLGAMERLVERNMIWVAGLLLLLKSPSMYERDVALAAVISRAIPVNSDKWDVMSRAELLAGG